MQSNQIMLTRFDDPDGLELRTGERPSPRKGRVVVRTEAAGISFAEVQLVSGLHPFPPRLPCVPGYDLVGRIVEVGAGVQRWKVGDRIAAMPRYGAWQQYVEVPVQAVAPLPEDIDAAEAVALVCNGVTAWQMLHRRAKARPGDTVLVHGAGGGVGTLLTTLAVQHKVRVIGTASPAKHPLIRALGGEPVDYTTGDVGPAIRTLAPDGVNAVFDHLGGRSLDIGWALLAPGGTLVSYDSSVEGYRTGQWFRPHVPAMRRVLKWKLARLAGTTRGRRATMFYVRPGDTFREDFAELVDLLRRGDLKPEIAGRFPLAEAATAVRQLQDRRTAGKLVLLP